MTTDTPLTPEQTDRRALALVRRFPFVLVGFLLATGAFGVLWYLKNLNEVAVATCNGDPMAVDEICRTRGRRGARYEDIYSEVLAGSAAGIEGGKIAGLIIAGLAALIIIFAIIRWVRDLSAVAALQPFPGLITTHADRTGGVTGFSMIIVALILVIMLQSMLNPKINPIFQWSVLIVVGLVIVAIVWFSRPKGSWLARMYPEGLTVLRRSQISHVPWTDASYLSTAGDNAEGILTLNWTVNGRQRKLSMLDHNAEVQIRQKINDVAWPIAQARVASGERIDFGAVSIEGGELFSKDARVPLDTLMRVTLTQGDSIQNVFQGTLAQVAVSPGDIANRDVLLHLLRQRGVDVATN